MTTPELIINKHYYYLAYNSNKEKLLDNQVSIKDIVNNNFEKIYSPQEFSQLIKDPLETIENWVIVSDNKYAPIIAYWTNVWYYNQEKYQMYLYIFNKSEQLFKHKLQVQSGIDCTKNSIEYYKANIDYHSNLNDKQTINITTPIQPYQSIRYIIGGMQNELSIEEFEKLTFKFVVEKRKKKIVNIPIDIEYLFSIDHDSWITDEQSEVEEVEETEEIEES